MHLDEKSLYNMIYKRKSFHLFRKIGNEKISAEQIEADIAYDAELHDDNGGENEMTLAAIYSLR